MNDKLDTQFFECFFKMETIQNANNCSYTFNIPTTINVMICLFYSLSLSFAAILISAVGYLWIDCTLTYCILIRGVCQNSRRDTHYSHVHARQFGQIQYCVNWNCRAKQSLFCCRTLARYAVLFLQFCSRCVQLRWVLRILSVIKQIV